MRNRALTPVFRGVDQHFRGGARGARNGRVALHEPRRQGAFAEKLKLSGERVGVGHLDSLQQSLEPRFALALVLQRDAGGGVLGIAELGDRVHVRTAPEVGAAEGALEVIEVAEDLLARGRIRRHHVAKACRQVGGDQLVLGRVVVVEGALADAGLLGHRVDADRADPLRIEQLVRGREDPFAW